MKIVCIGGGPGGLYSALLLKKSCPSHDVTVIDRNPPGATYGWGVVFSDETLGFLNEADPETYREITDGFVHWEAIDIYYQGDRIRSGGHAFSGIARARLLHILQRRCASLGVRLNFETEAPSVSRFDEFDLIIACDGVNSSVRAHHADIFKPSFDTHPTKFIWLGAPLTLDAFTFFFRQTKHGMLQVHAYPFEKDSSTFIVECGQETWRRAGLEGSDEQKSLEFCEHIFASELKGQSLLSNRSTWLNFVTLRNETWHHRNIVLLGDAAHTAHFSVGSGTKMAMEDAIALNHALERNETLKDALVEYEELRQPVIERTQMAARDSSMWFENVPRYAQFQPTQFAFSLLTRSRRITYENLKLRDPYFCEEVDRWFLGSARCVKYKASKAPPPARTPLVLKGITLPNRVVVRDGSSDDAEDGMAPDETRGCWREISSSGAGLLMTPPVAVSREGRISAGSTGLYTSGHSTCWKGLVGLVHDSSQTKVGIQLHHAGRRGATRPRGEGADRPLGADSWPLFSASPLAYTRFSQIPIEIGRESMSQVCEDFARASCWASDASFDLLELQFGHGYLVASFLSPLTNLRTDQYGGSLGSRLRFPLEIFDAVRQIWPRDRILSVSLCVSDWVRGGLEVSEARTIAAIFKEHGCDVIHVVTGQTTADARPVYGRAWQTHFSDEIRNEVKIPTITSGNITAADEVNTILAAGRADLCIASPEALPESGAMRNDRSR